MMNKRSGSSYYSKLGAAAFLGRNSRHLSIKESKNLVLVKGSFPQALEALANGANDDAVVGRAGRYGANARFDKEVVQANAQGIVLVTSPFLS